MFARTPFAIERLLALGAPADRRDHWGTSPIEALSGLGARAAPLVALLVARGVAAPLDVHARLGDPPGGGGRSPGARPREHDATPRGWAETSLEVTRNPECAEVERHLRGRST
jgi:hypothetical protein